MTQEILHHTKKKYSAQANSGSLHSQEESLKQPHMDSKTFDIAQNCIISVEKTTRVCIIVCNILWFYYDGSAIGQHYVIGKSNAQEKCKVFNSSHGLGLLRSKGLVSFIPTIVHIMKLYEKQTLLTILACQTVSPQHSHAETTKS